MLLHLLCGCLRMILITHYIYINWIDPLNGAYNIWFIHHPSNWIALSIFLLILKIISTYSLRKKLRVEFRFVLICCSIFLIFSRTKVNRMWKVLWAYYTIFIFSFLGRKQYNGVPIIARWQRTHAIQINIINTNYFCLG